jgi:uncharacterized lipoprotein YmbA
MRSNFQRLYGFCRSAGFQPAVSPISNSQRTFSHLTDLTFLPHLTPSLALSRIAFVAIVSTLLTGCLFKPKAVSTRHFVLTPISTIEPTGAATEQLSVGISHVKMPSYLLQSSIAVRNGANEIEYLDNASWGERMDQSFQQTLAANLSRLLASDRIYLTDWARDQVKVRVFINVQQFDVDTSGHGTLLAQWRITSPDNDTPLKSGHTQLARTGALARGQPAVVAATLSDLEADFSRDLAQSIRESANSSL